MKIQKIIRTANWFEKPSITTVIQTDRSYLEINGNPIDELFKCLTMVKDFEWELKQREIINYKTAKSWKT